MANKLTKKELIERIERLMSCRYEEDEMMALIQEIGENVPCPCSHITDYIFYSKNNPDAGTILERMLAYKPIQL